MLSVRFCRAQTAALGQYRSLLAFQPGNLLSLANRPRSMLYRNGVPEVVILRVLSIQGPFRKREATDDPHITVP
jgi:hypothetical protein